MQGCYEMCGTQRARKFEEEYLETCSNNGVCHVRMVYSGQTHADARRDRITLLSAHVESEVGTLDGLILIRLKNINIDIVNTR